jgi:hypothetical protein
MSAQIKTMRVIKFNTATGEIVYMGEAVEYSGASLELILSTPPVEIGEYTTAWQEVNVAQ